MDFVDTFPAGNDPEAVAIDPLTGLIYVLDGSAKILVYEYQAAMFHAKSAVFDGHLGLVGSSNLDRQSFQHSYEVNLVTVGAGVPGAIDRLFEEDLERSAEVTLHSLARRGALTRTLERTAP